MDSVLRWYKMVSLQTKFQLGCVILAGLGAFLATRAVRAVSDHNSILIIFLYGVGTSLSSLISFLLWDIQNRRPANSHNFRSLTYQCLFILINSYLYRWALKRFNRYSSNVKDVQEKTLLAALAANKDSAYGIMCKFSSIKDMKDYVNKVPLITYEDVEPFVDRIANGEEGILTSSKVSALARSSGTTGKPKLIPIARGAAVPFLESWALGLGSFFKRSKYDLGRVIGLRYKCNISFTRGGLRVATIGQLFTPYHVHFVSPRTVYDIMDQTTSFYLHAVFGLQEKDVTIIDALQAPMALTFFRILHTRWKDVCNDIAKGQLNECLKLSHEQRQSLNSLLTQNVSRAEELKQIFQNGFTGVGTRIWPRLTCVWMSNTGSFAVQAKVLADVYLKGVYQVSTTHGASEGGIGINMATQQEIARQVVYTFRLTGTFYEFIPVEDTEKQNPGTLFLHELTLGGVYEVVLTNCTCLYRYRLGDVIKVVDFQNQVPVYEFQYRVGLLLNLTIEKTTEKHFQDSVDIVMATLPREVILVDYTTTDSTVVTQQILQSDSDESGADSGSHNSYYVAFFEFEGDGKPFLLDEQKLAQFDASLQVTNTEYREHRNKGLIGSMVVHQVALGSFHQLQCLLTAESSTMQYKTPRVLRQKELIKMLIDQSIHSSNK